MRVGVVPCNCATMVISWKNAEQQADLVAKYIIGNPEPWNDVPWFWSDQYHYNFQMSGLFSESANIVSRGENLHGPVIYFQLDGDKIIAAAGFGEGTSAARDCRIAHMLIENHSKVREAKLSDLSVKLKSLLR